MATESTEHPSSSDVDDNDTERKVWAFVLPFVVLMLGTFLYPSFELEAGGGADVETLVDEGKTRQYCLTVGGLVIALSGLLFYFRDEYLKQFPFRVSPLSVIVGVVGIVAWIGLCGLGLEAALFESLGMSKSIARPSFNPFAQISEDGSRYAFLFFRFSLLAVLVPIIEELFLRGWLIRFMENPNWWTVSLTSLSFTSIAAASAYGVLAHPGEAIAALVWFSMVSWLMVRTGSIWDCVVAHGVTNLLLGLYVLWQGAWHLW